MTAVRISDLCFGYKKKETILDGLSLNVPQGSIYGFLGRNGAGKTTTIRNILGLLKSRSGSIFIHEQNIKNAQISLFRKVGSLIEEPSLYQHLSAIDNLKIACKYHALDFSVIDKTLNKVGLLKVRKKKTKAFSTGMKQRLGLALAIVHDPDLLILDEPTNGLDPNGIIEMREIITRLSDEGKTVMLSSHLLTEIEKISTHIGILDQGKIVFEGSLMELEKMKTSNFSVVMKTDNNEKAKSFLEKKYDVNILDQAIQVKISHEAMVPNIINALVLEGLALYEVHQVKPDLENIFMNITTT